MSSDNLVRPVTFLNGNGHILFGMLHAPASVRREVGIIILSPGIKNRVAPHRLYVKMAYRFCDLGFPVLRFDPEGLGDSEGDINENRTADLYGSIQVGRFVGDTICAMDWMEKECRIRRFVLAGLCGGAITGLLTGARDRRVDALLGLGIPVTLDSSDVDPGRYMTAGQLMGLREKYKKKILNLNAWLRFLTFRTDYRMLLKSFFSPSLKKRAKERKGRRGTKETDGMKKDQLKENLNTLFPAAFQGMLSGGRAMLFIFSESDRLYWEFEEKFMERYPEYKPDKKGLFTVKVVSEANHIFSFSQWQEDMFRLAMPWLEKQYKQSGEKE